MTVSSTCRRTEDNVDILVHIARVVIGLQQNDVHSPSLRSRIRITIKAAILGKTLALAALRNNNFEVAAFVNKKLQWHFHGEYCRYVL
jgi:hypothetical protein